MNGDPNAAPLGVALPHMDGLALFHNFLEPDPAKALVNLADFDNDERVLPEVVGDVAFSAGGVTVDAAAGQRLRTTIRPTPARTTIAVIWTPAPAVGTSRVLSNRIPTGGGDGLQVEAGGQLNMTGVYVGGIDTAGSASGFVTRGKWRTVAGVIRPGVGRKVFNFQSGQSAATANTTERAVTDAPAFALGSTPTNAAAADTVREALVGEFATDLTDAQIIENMAAFTLFALFYGVDFS
ncbi:hypothetical protein GCM10008171_33120 [Methylopila jiangsuensis]|uniref:Uncharacterized protein n=2 Tax=Methylopila jiangsuensis TaxID=586230 RepID=A0A9W6N568_9HYPH|nr:hypothetical protein GCM10008171_33120 [Methylopila jiangsuensis]